jgi:hypothetical protein
MGFMDKEHEEKVKHLDRLWHGFAALAELAKQYGIKDIFQDNNAKLLQQLVYLNFKPLPGREGNDAIDEFGAEWEMKSANEELVTGFSTHHHLNKVILKKYRVAHWMFTIYSNILIKEVFVMNAASLEPLFQHWEDKLNGRKGQAKMESINNPKIPLKFVRERGICVFPFSDPPINPAKAVRKIRTRD